MATQDRTRLRLAFTGIAFTGLVLGGLVAPDAILAHAALDTVTPADQSTVAGSPAGIVMTFVENLDPARSSIRVVDAAGTVVAEGGTVPGGNPREMDLALATSLAAGVYTIRWTTFSTEDNEQARGTTTFTVAAASTPSPSPTPSVATAAPSVAPSVAPSIPPAGSASPSAPPTAPAASTSDAVIPIVAALLVLAGLGVWLLRGRSRGRS